MNTAQWKQYQPRFMRVSLFKGGGGEQGTDFGMGDEWWKPSPVGTEDGFTHNPDYSPEGQPEYEPNYLAPMGGGKNRARKARAKLARAEYEDYKKRFRPIENELIGQVGNRSVYNDEVARGRDAVNKTFAQEPGEYQRGLNRYGVNQDASQRKQSTRDFGLGKAKALTESANRTRSRVKDREMQIYAGTAGANASLRSSPTNRGGN